MSNLARFNDHIVKDTFYLDSDFWGDQVDTDFVDTVTDSGSVTMGDAVNGIAALVASDGTVADNDEAYFASPNEVFLVAADRSIVGRWYIQFTEANTDDANVAVGFASAVAANLIVDDGAGLRTTGNWFAIYKIDGGTKWIAGCRNGTTVFTNTSSTTAGGTAYQELEINILDFDGVSVQVTYKVDNVPLRDATTNLPIEHILPIASSTEMQVFAGVKNGGANLETLNWDYVICSQTR